MLTLPPSFAFSSPLIQTCHLVFFCTQNARGLLVSKALPSALMSSSPPRSCLGQIHIIFGPMFSGTFFAVVSSVAVGFFRRRLEKRAFRQRNPCFSHSSNAPHFLMLLGKSTELLRRIRRYTIAKRRCLMVKYKADTRYSQTEFSTHDRYVPLPLPPLPLLQSIRQHFHLSPLLYQFL